MTIDRALDVASDAVKSVTEDTTDGSEVVKGVMDSATWNSPFSTFWYFLEFDWCQKSLSLSCYIMYLHKHKYYIVIERTIITFDVYFVA